MRSAALLVWLALVPRPAAAVPVVLRIATAAPDGTAWAREFRAFGRELETRTQGNVAIKWYWGGVAGDERGVETRIARGQLDGTASGGGLCQKISPTMRALRVQHLLRRHEEATWLMGRLHAPIAAEVKERGLVFLGGPVIGRELVFSRAPLRTFGELKRARLYRWNVDEAGIALSRAAGLTIVPLDLPDVARALDAGELEGLVAIPASMLAFQWIPRVRYGIDQVHGFLIGCLIVSQRAWDALRPEDQELLRATAHKAIARVDTVSREMDETFLGGLLAKQGVTLEPPGKGLEKELLQAMRAASEKPEAAKIPPELLARIAALLAER